jgi:hypothetical protein
MNGTCGTLTALTAVPGGLFNEADGININKLITTIRNIYMILF